MIAYGEVWPKTDIDTWLKFTLLANPTSHSNQKITP
ncbi:protein of unknown function [Sterolibacterium denitrificans]|uniref:Uncharacterized protein n=1 Tax=Sterolibacterium denitrificans TaxID=157592 RepID=A0A7Z7MUG4_9PROT|nr:protein of unknown function [Sterolibacterium denitrificans]